MLTAGLCNLSAGSGSDDEDGLDDEGEPLLAIEKRARILDKKR